MRDALRNCMERIHTKHEPVELVKIAVPVIAEAIAVILFIMMLAVWSGIVSGRLPA